MSPLPDMLRRASWDEHSPRPADIPSFEKKPRIAPGLFRQQARWLLREPPWIIPAARRNSYYRAVSTCAGSHPILTRASQSFAP